ncbi:homeodomain-like superfamily protein [Actinidia rufa]|uniref:Homeodomain-like superfamily protein n=1 Tax=Actinidia rufa TaxID=165716 RepID=A0A7J0H676_9ERIC|nr:homeodomain-like superfamily protein [Actinidia rufa]
MQAVRRMKSSPLTVEEIARIQEGLKVFKLDWMSVWKFVVPYRDPSLLPRQWRIATGTQRSYKSTADKKEKRRLYASNRRKCKDAALATWKTSSEKEDCQTDNAGGEINCGRDYVENEDEVYVHEAFLADWRPGTSFSVSSRLPVSNPRERNQPSDLPLQEGSHDMEQRNNSGPGESLPPLGLEFPAAIKYSRNLDILSDFTNHRHYTPAVEPNHPVSDMTLRPSKSQFCSRPYRSRRTNSARLVKLAPDLPPVNLPPSVRVMSQSAFKSYQCGASAKVPVADAATEKIVSQFPHVEKSGSSHPIKSAESKRNQLENSDANQHRQECFVLRDKSVGGEKGESDLNMHPLLLQSSGNGHLPYYPLNCADSSPSPFNFFSSFQPQLNLSLLHNPHQANQAINYFDKSSKLKGTTSSAGGIDFHPLLQKADVNSDAVTAHSAAKLSVHLEPLKDSCAHLQDPIDLGRPETRVSNSLLATSSKSSSLNEKATDLDLDIHLSFSSRKEKAIGRRNVSENNPTASNLSALGSGTTMESQGTKGSCYQRNEYCHTSSILNRTSNKLDSGDRALFVSSNNISTYGVNNQGDQSLPEIVMEQEELSDSEEEIGEHVEFECEEMDDSEGDEGSDTEQIMNT